MRRFTQDLVRRAGALVGLSIVPTWRLELLPMSEHLRRLFAVHEVDLVVDVGANLGTYRDFLRNHVGYEGQIVSFEPIPALAAAMRRRALGDAGWTVIESALGDMAGSCQFNVMVGSTLSSMLQPNPKMPAHYEALNQVAEVITVEVHRLDDLVEGVDVLARCRRPF